MEKEFVKYEIALELKELGFDEICISRYCIITEWEKPTGTILLQQTDCTFLDKNLIKAPIYQQAFRFFREKYNLHAEPYTVDMGAIEYCFQIRDLYSEKYVYDNFVGATSYSGTFNTSEEAELACLVKLIEIVKNK